MRARSRLVLIALTASLIMGFAVSSASAGRLSVSNTRYRITWASLKIAGIEAGASVFCPVTLEGSFHSATIRKTRGALIGAVTRGKVKSESCFEGRAIILQETLPWHLTYESFSSALPRIEVITFLLRRYAILVELGLFGFMCLYADLGHTEENLAMRVEVGPEGALFGVRFLPERFMGWHAGSEFCPRRAILETTGEMFLLGSSSTRITVRLI
jgi:hypothetical protein